MSRKTLRYKEYRLEHEIRQMIDYNANLIDKYHSTLPIFFKKRKQIAEEYRERERLIKVKAYTLFGIQRKLENFKGRK